MTAGSKAIAMTGPDPLADNFGPGRPTLLDEIVATNDQGQPVTAAQHVLARMAQGLSCYDAALGADIRRGTIDNWARAGAKARIRRTQGLDLTENEQNYLRFLNDYERVQSDIEAARLGRIVQVADGGHQRSKIVRKRVRNEAGEMVVVEETVTLETAEPNWQANAWILERRFPGKYRRRLDIEVQQAFDDTGEEPEQQARELAASLRAYQQGIIDATSIEVTDV